MTTPDPETIRQVLWDSPSVTVAAERLGVSRNTLYRWMRQHNIIVGRRLLPTHSGDLPGDGSAA
jgi:transposase-like protein